MVGPTKVKARKSFLLTEKFPCIVFFYQVNKRVPYKCFDVQFTIGSGSKMKTFQIKTVEGYFDVQLCIKLCGIYNSSILKLFIT